MRGTSVLFLAAVLVLVSWATAQDLRPVSPPYGPVPLLDVIDGDTVVLGSNLGPRTVRLIGIDAPEMSEGRPALAAREALAALLPPGKLVWAELGAESEDRYARLLAYLYVEDRHGDWDVYGRRAVQVNLALVEQGWADTLTIPPNTAYAELYAAAKAEAQARGVGLWAEAQDGSAPAADSSAAADLGAAGAALGSGRAGDGAGSDGAGSAGAGAGAAGAAAGAAAASGAAGAPARPRLHCALVNPSTPNDAGAEWVSVWLEGPTDTTGYYLWDEGSMSTFRLPSGVQPVGELRVTNPGQGVWNNSGDTIYLMRGGEVVDSWTYGRESAVEDRVACRDPAR